MSNISFGAITANTHHESRIIGITYVAKDNPLNFIKAIMLSIINVNTKIDKVHVKNRPMCALNNTKYNEEAINATK